MNEDESYFAILNWPLSHACILIVAPSLTAVNTWVVNNMNSMVSRVEATRRPREILIGETVHLNIKGDVINGSN